MQQPLLEQLERNKVIRDGARLLVAVSGGIDSVVLLHLLKRLTSRRSLVLSAAHLDHGMRPHSAGDAQFVKELCHRWSIPLTVERCDVPALSRARKLSLEMAAREARYEFLRRAAEDKGAEGIVLAHHRGDQAETFLLRVLRGSGLSGLAGMRPLRDELLRPLLDIGRSQIEAYAEEQGLEWVEDPSNRDLRHLRNRVRQQLLPQMRTFNPRIEERLAFLCKQQQIEEDFWRLQVDKALPDLIFAEEGDDGVRLSRPGLLALHPALRMRVLREVSCRVRSDQRGLEEKHLRALEALLGNGQAQASLDLPGLWAARRYEQLWLRSGSPGEGQQPFSLELSVPGEVQLPDGRWIRAGIAGQAAGESARVVEFAAEQLPDCLTVRSFRAGDRFHPSGSAGRKKLKDFFIDQKLEQEVRRNTPLVLAGEQILWVAGVRRSALARVQDGQAPVLRLELI